MARIEKQNKRGNDILPDGWRLESLPDLVSHNSDSIKIGPFGSALKKEFLTPSGFKVYGQENVYARNINIGDRYISGERFNKLKSCQLVPGDFIVSMMGTVGKCMVVPTDVEPGIMDSHLLRIRLDQEKLLNSYLEYFFQSRSFLKQVKQLSVGGIMEGLSSKIVKQILISIPSNQSEQEAIANALSDADAYIESLEKLIEKKRLIKKGVMQEVLSGKRRLVNSSTKWKNVYMRELITQPATYGIVTSGKFVDNGVPMLRSGEIHDGFIKGYIPNVTKEKSSEYLRTILKKNDVVIALVGYPGATAKIPDALIGGNISRAVGLLRFGSDVNPDYMVQFLNSDLGRRMVLAPSAGSAQQVVNLSALNKLSFLLPTQEEQEFISKIATDLDLEITTLETNLSKAKQIKQAMMQELLTGRIRLV